MGTLLCRRAIVDEQTRGLSAIDIVDKLQVVGLPSVPVTLPAPLAIITMWKDAAGDQETIHDRVTLINPQGERVELGTYYSKPQGINRIALNLPGLPLHGAGVYHIVVDRQRGEDWTMLDDLELEIVALALPNQAQGSP